MKPMEDSPMWLGLATHAAPCAPRAVEPEPPPPYIEPTQLSEPRIPPLPIRLTDLRGRLTPLRLADLRGDDSADRHPQPVAA